MVHPNEIVDYARTWVGTRWRHQGRGRSGIDCVGLMTLTMDHFDIPYQGVMGYRRDPGPHFMKAIKDNSLPYPYLTPIHGSVGIFNDSIMPCHTGIFSVTDGVATVIHAEAFPSMSCVEEEFEENLKDKIVSIRLFREVEYVR